MSLNPAPYEKLLQELLALHTAKSSDYGAPEDSLANVRASEGFGIPAWVGALVRANDKMIRLQNLAKQGSLTNEAARDSFLDLASYALIGLILYEEDSNNEDR